MLQFHIDCLYFFIYAAENSRSWILVQYEANKSMKFQKEISVFFINMRPTLTILPRVVSKGTPLKEKVENIIAYDYMIFIKMTLLYGSWLV